MGRLVVAVLAALIGLALTQTEPPSVVRSTYEIKETYLLGNTYRHAIFDVEFDQEIYYQESWATPCIENSTSCTASSLNLTPPSDLNNYEWIDLPKGQWVTVRASFTDKKYLKFNLARNTSNPCPSVAIRINSFQGEPNLYISNKWVPTQEDKMWFFISWATTDSWHIHPNHLEYGYGDWYILQTAQPPATNEVYYEIMFDTFETPTCGARTPDIPNDPADPMPWTQLQDGRSWIGPFPLNEYQYFRLFVYSECVDFATSSRQYNYTQFGDVDLFAAIDPSLPYPDDAGYQWAAQTDNDGTLVVRGACNPRGNSVPWPIYITSYNWAQDGEDVVIATITATTNKMVIFTRPITGLNPYSFRNAMANGGAVLYCGDEERYVCEYPHYEECHIGVNNPNLYGCCSPFTPMAPTRDPLRANQIFPDNKDLSIYTTYLRSLPWSDYMNRTTDLLPKHLRWSVIMDVRSGTSLLHNIAAKQPSTCRIEFTNVYSNKDGQPVSGNVTFTERIPTCNYTRLQILTTEALSLVEQMQRAKEYAALQLLHVRFQFLTIDDAWLGCKANLEKYLTFTNVTTDFPEQTTCPEGNYGFQSQTYLTDACCNKPNQVQGCCQNKTLQFTNPVVQDYDASSLEESCQVGECATRSANVFVQSLASAEDPVTGCTAVWKKEASADEITRLTEFAPKCRVQLLGFYDMLGSECTSDADCYYGALCNTATGRCNHTEDHVIKCWAESMSAEVAFALFDYWGNSSQYTTLTLEDQIRTRMTTKSFCTGPGSMDFRNHLLFHKELDDCVDTCTPNNEIDLEPRCFESDLQYCPIPPECDQSTTIVGLCFRRFYPRAPDAAKIAQCEAEQQCNWDACPDQATRDNTTLCRELCLGPTSAPISNVCLNCRGDDCIRETTITTAGACTTGYCSTNRSVVNRATCLSTGTCTVACSGGPCTSQSACEAAGECRGFETLVENNITSGCFTPFVSDVWGVALCGDDLSESPYPFGCLNENITSESSCSQQGFLWVEEVNTKPECDAQIAAHQACYSDANGRWTSMDTATCATCQNTYTSPLHWETGTWTPGYMVPLLWTPPRYQSIRTFKPALDYEFFRSELEAAIVASKSLSFSTESFCKYSAEMSAMKTIACDCLEDGANCFSGASSRQIALARACPYVPSNITNNYVSISIPEDAFEPTEFCKTLELSLLPASLYELNLGNKLSSEIFLAKIPSSFSVVKNENSATVGQIVTNGISVIWNMETEPKPLTMCIPIDPATKPQYSVYKEYSLGYIPQGRKSIQVVGPAVRQGQFICGNFTRPRTYFGIINVPDYETQEEYDPGTRIMAIVSAVLYYGLIVGSIVQIYRVVKVKPPTWELKLGFAVIVIVFAAFRGTYMAIPPSVYGGDSVTILFVFEFPSFIFFVMFTTVLYLWAQVLYRVRTMKRKSGQIEVIWKAYVAVNAGMFALFIIFVIIYYTITEKAPLPCQQGEIKAASGNKFTTNLAYLIFNGIVVLLLALVYLVLGISLVRHLGRTSKMSLILQMTLLVTCTFVPMFLVKSALILWSAIANGVVPLIVFSLLEIIPAAVLLYFILPQLSSGSEVVSMTRTSSTPGNMRSMKSLRDQTNVTTGTSSANGATSTSE